MTAMDAQRIEIKLYLENEDAMSPEDAFRAFNAWIPETGDEVLVDVADYSHVESGPKTLLVGHEANYALDNTDSRWGVSCSRKQALDGQLADRIRQVVSQALKVCRRLETEADFEGVVKFRGNELLITVNDRLNAPNTEATAAEFEPHLRTVLDQMFAGEEVALARDPDPRQRYSVRATTEASLEVAALLANLGD